MAARKLRIKVPLNLSLVKELQDLLDRRVKLRKIMHMTCTYIHTFMIHDYCYVIDIMWYAMSVLAEPRLMISTCVEGSAGKHHSDA